jgi:hypothetical protein
MLPNVTLAENIAGGIHPVESITGCEIPLLSTRERWKEGYGVMMSMKPSQLPIPNIREVAMPNAVRSNRNHNARAANAMTAYNCT